MVSCNKELIIDPKPEQTYSALKIQLESERDSVLSSCDVYFGKTYCTCISSADHDVIDTTATNTRENVVISNNLTALKTECRPLPSNAVDTLQLELTNYKVYNYRLKVTSINFPSQASIILYDNLTRISYNLSTSNTPVKTLILPYNVTSPYESDPHRFCFKIAYL